MSKGMREFARGIIIGILLLILPILPVWQGMPVRAATTADVTVNATPAYVGISDNVTEYGFGTVVESNNYTTVTSYVGITNTSSIQTDITIFVTTANWTSAGNPWIHSNTATAGVDTAGLVTNRGGTWGVGDIVVQSTITGTPQYIYENCPAFTNFNYGLMLVAPSFFSDGINKSIIVRVSAVSG